MNPIQRFLRSLGPAGAVSNARRSCDELRVRAQVADAIDRRFAPSEPRHSAERRAEAA
ncbi:MAG: hypothetical protein NVSMB4_07170 [Acidimicrobiales bacterium]